RRYGEDGAACRVFEATLAAAGAFRSARLPEFIAGMQRQAGAAPVHTPRADPLQAWSAGAAPFMLSEMLGLEADGFARQLHVRRPVLPEGIEAVGLRDLRVGEARVSLRFRRGQDGAVRGEVTEREGEVEVVS
ncbi:MAG: amylo-alpha-1,6-glucosidase, partial [Pseudomonadota bacterium]|nr:amylo-alpha-1,6-glucosidase [Pseudomonadota bacterium]